MGGQHLQQKPRRSGHKTGQAVESRILGSENAEEVLRVLKELGVALSCHLKLNM